MDPISGTVGYTYARTQAGVFRVREHAAELGGHGAIYFEEESNYYAFVIRCR